MRGWLYSKTFYTILAGLVCAGAVRSAFYLAGWQIPLEVACVLFIGQAVAAAALITLVYDLHRHRRL